MERNTGSTVVFVVFLVIVIADPFDGLVTPPPAGLEVGPDTTRIVEPLDDRGWPDVAAAWNGRERERIAAPGNVFPELARICGRDFCEEHAEAFAAAGIEIEDPLPPLPLMPRLLMGAAGEEPLEAWAGRCAEHRAALREVAFERYDDCRFPIALAPPAPDRPCPLLLSVEAHLTSLLALLIVDLDEQRQVGRLHRATIRLLEAAALAERSGSASLAHDASIARLAVAHRWDAVLRELPDNPAVSAMATVHLARLGADGVSETLVEEDRWLAMENLRRWVQEPPSAFPFFAEHGPDPTRAVAGLHQLYDELADAVRRAGGGEAAGLPVFGEGWLAMASHLERPLAERMLFGRSLAERREDAALAVLQLVLESRSRFLAAIDRHTRHDLPEAAALLRADIAIHRFRREHGRAPASLAEAGIDDPGLELHDGWARARAGAAPEDPGP